jgi:hypothetical protein
MILRIKPVSFRLPQPTMLPRAPKVNKELHQKRRLYQGQILRMQCAILTMLYLLHWIRCILAHAQDRRKPFRLSGQPVLQVRSCSSISHIQTEPLSQLSQCITYTPHENGSNSILLATTRRRVVLTFLDCLEVISASTAIQFVVTVLTYWVSQL